MHSMAKILVINPYIIDFKLYDEWMHPLGLYFLIVSLIKNGHEVIFFNCLKQSTSTPHKKFNTGFFDSQEIEKPSLYNDINRKYKIYGCPEEELKTFLQSIPTPDLICLGSMMTYWADGVLETARQIRNVFSDIPLILGGIAAQLIPDYFKTHIKNCQIAGSLFTDTKTDTCLQLAAPISSHDSLTPAFSFSKSPHGALLLSLGCPLLCSYCASSTLQPSFIQRPVSTISQEIEYMVLEKKVTDFAFCDDALLYKPQVALIPVLEFVKKSGFNLRFHTPNGLHLRFVEEDLMMQLREAGFKTLRFGYESSALKHRDDTCGKGIRKEVAEKIALIKKCGFKSSEVGVYIMAGLKDQTPSEVLEEMDFIGSLGINVKPVFLSPVPGTPLYKNYIQQFPQLGHDPLWHNDSFFITQLPGWNTDLVEEIRLKARALNSAHII
jgi:hypothetical protein